MGRRLPFIALLAILGSVWATTAGSGAPAPKVPKLNALDTPINERQFLSIRDLSKGPQADGTLLWYRRLDASKAMPGRRLLLTIYCNNSEPGTTAKNCFAAVTLPKEPAKDLTIQVAVGGDNVETVRDSVEVSFPTPMLLKYHLGSTVQWRAEENRERRQGERDVEHSLPDGVCVAGVPLGDLEGKPFPHARFQNITLELIADKPQAGSDATPSTASQGQTDSDTASETPEFGRTDLSSFWIRGALSQSDPTWVQSLSDDLAWHQSIVASPGDLVHVRLALHWQKGERSPERPSVPYLHGVAGLARLLRPGTLSLVCDGRGMPIGPTFSEDPLPLPIVSDADATLCFDVGFQGTRAGENLIRLSLGTRQERVQSVELTILDRTALPARADSWLKKAEGYRADTRYSDAEACYREAARLDPRNPAAYQGIGEVLLVAPTSGVRDHDEAAGWIESAMKLGGATDKRRLDLGMAQERIGEISEARNSYLDVLKVSPASVAAMLCLADLENGQKAYAQAGSWLRKALSISGQSQEGVVQGALGSVPLWRVQEGLAFDCLMQVYNAATSASRGVEQGPVLDSATQGRLLEAIRFADLATTANPNAVEAWMDRGDAFTLMLALSGGDQKPTDGYRQAVTSYEKACRLDKKASRAWLGLGMLHGLAKEWDEATTCLETVLQLASAQEESAAALSLLRYCYEERRDWQKLLDVELKINQMRPGLAVQWGKPLSVEELRQRVETEPKDEFAKLALISALFARARTDQDVLQYLTRRQDLLARASVRDLLASISGLEMAIWGSKAPGSPSLQMPPDAKEVHEFEIEALKRVQESCLGKQKTKKGYGLRPPPSASSDWWEETRDWEVGEWERIYREYMGPTPDTLNQLKALLGWNKWDRLAELGIVDPFTTSEGYADLPRVPDRPAASSDRDRDDADRRMLSVRFSYKAALIEMIGVPAYAAGLYDEADEASSGDDAFLLLAAGRCYAEGAAALNRNATYSASYDNPYWAGSPLRELAELRLEAGVNRTSGPSERARALHDLGDCYFQDHDYASGIPDYPDDHRLESARVAWQRALELTPETQERERAGLEYNIGLTYLSQKVLSESDADSAEGYLSQSIGLNPDYPNAYGVRGWIYWRQSNDQKVLSGKAKALAERALQSWEGKIDALGVAGQSIDPSLKLLCALAAERAGQWGKAISYVENVLSENPNTQFVDQQLWQEKPETWRPAQIRDRILKSMEQESTREHRDLYVDVSSSLPAVLDPKDHAGLDQALICVLYLRNNTTHEIQDIQISGRVEKPWDFAKLPVVLRGVGPLAPGAEISVQAFITTPRPEDMARLRVKEIEATITVEWGPFRIQRMSLPIAVRVLDPARWGYRTLPDTILTADSFPAFQGRVDPEDHGVRAFLDKAHFPTMDANGSYEGRLQVMESLFRELGKQVSYHGEQPDTIENGRHVTLVRWPFQTLEEHGGDCKSLAVLLASCLQHFGIKTAFAFVPGHVLLLAYPYPESNEAALWKPAGFGRLLWSPGGTPDSAWLPTETTDIDPERKKSFEDAVHDAREELDLNIGKVEIFPRPQTKAAFATKSIGSLLAGSNTDCTTRQLGTAITR